MASDCAMAPSLCNTRPSTGLASPFAVRKPVRCQPARCVPDTRTKLKLNDSLIKRGDGSGAGEYIASVAYNEVHVKTKQGAESGCVHSTAVSLSNLIRKPHIMQRVQVVALSCLLPCMLQLPAVHTVCGTPQHKLCAC